MRPPLAMSRESFTAPVLEVFRSRQGEGVCIGDDQIFVRFGGCNLVCDYCDTPESIPLNSGQSSPLDVVAAQVENLNPSGPPLAVTLTGGEPLLHAEFLSGLLPRLRQQGHAVHLETNGTLPRALAAVAAQCQWIAMDFKPRSATGRDLWEAHRWFLETGAEKIFVKLVLTNRTTDAEVMRAVDLISGVRPTTPLVLQPSSPQADTDSVGLERLASWWRQAAARLPDVRILPQVHRLWHIP